MAHNSLAPHFVRIYYTSGSTPHVQTLQTGFVGPVVIGTEPEVMLRSGSTLPVGTAIAAYIDVIKASFRSADTFTGWEAYGVDLVTNEPFFIYGDDLNVVGTSAANTLQNGQSVFSFGTVAGGLLKIYLMEPAVAQDLRIPLRTSAVGFTGVFTTYILGANNWIKGRDDAFPIRGIYQTTKVNDMLRKKQILDQ
jgi:hypothetical protein